MVKWRSDNRPTPTMVFTKHEAEITDRLRQRETSKAIWFSLFGHEEPPNISYEHFTRLVRRYLPEVLAQNKPPQSIRGRV